MTELTAADVIGAWELLDFEVHFGDGREPVSPFGRDAQGQLVYSASGKMSAVLSAAKRAELPIERLERAAKAPPQSKADAFDTYLSYAGRYRVENGNVHHEVELALVPNIVGLEQVRRAHLDEDVLTLSYDVETRRGVQHYVLRWRRA